MLRYLVLLLPCLHSQTRLKLFILRIFFHRVIYFTLLVCRKDFFNCLQICLELGYLYCRNTVFGCTALCSVFSRQINLSVWFHCVYFSMCQSCRKFSTIVAVVAQIFIDCAGFQEKSECLTLDLLSCGRVTTFNKRQEGNQSVVHVCREEIICFILYRTQQQKERTQQQKETCLSSRVG